MMLDRTAMVVPPNADPRVRRLYDYWCSIRPGPDALPGRQHLDPADLVPLLPSIWILDVQRAPLRFRYRLVGTEHRVAIGRELTGLWVDEAFPSFAAEPMSAQFVETALEGVPAFREGPPAYHVDDRYQWTERLLTPLARDARTVDMVLAITVYLPGPDDPGPGMASVD
jgi:hypothetical protein